MQSRGGETGGLTILDALHEYESHGYEGQFAAREGGQIKCFSCDKRNDADAMHLKALRRIEGVSDPDDMAVVAALQCPGCSARGTAVFKYGPGAPPEDGDALRVLEDVRKASSLSPTGELVTPALEREANIERTPAMAKGPTYEDIHPGMPSERDGSAGPSTR